MPPFVAERRSYFWDTREPLGCLLVRGQFEDGTKIKFHLSDHFNVTPTGAKFFFTHCHD